MQEFTQQIHHQDLCFACGMINERNSEMNEVIILLLQDKEKLSCRGEVVFDQCNSRFKVLFAII